jgi:hypothetical protein
MKRTTFVTSLVVASWITAPATQQAPATANEPAHNVFVLTGCLERGIAPTAFRLTDATTVGQAPPRPSTSAASVGNTDEDVYELQAATSVSEQGFTSEKLQPEVGARVEITIRPIEAASPTPPRSISADAVEKPAESPRQRYTVITLNRRADSCV